MVLNIGTKLIIKKSEIPMHVMPKILGPLTKLIPEPEKHSRWPYDGKRCPHEWPDVNTIRYEFENFYIHNSTLNCHCRI